MFNFTIDQINKFPILREILSPLTIPRHTLYVINEDAMLDDIPVYCIYGNNILRKFIHQDMARLVFENYLSEISSSIPFSGDVDINLFSNTINGLSPEQFLEVIRVKFLE